jgi:hypothetical protein
MTDPGIEHHRPIEYAYSDLRFQAGFTVSAAPDARAIVVSGACPACGGHTSTTWEYGSPQGYKGVFSRRAAPASAPPAGSRTVYCDCGRTHANRPADAWDNGCGAYWQVALP